MDWNDRAFVAAVLGVASGLAWGQVTYTAVIVPGQAAPGSATGTFNGPQNPACQTYGHASVMVFLVGTPNPGLDNTGVWRASAGSTTVLGLQNMAVAGLGGRRLAVIEAPTQNRTGGSAFAGNLEAPFTDDRVLLYSASGGLAGVAVQEGMAAPGLAGVTFGTGFTQAPSEYALNDAGQLAFVMPLMGAGVTGQNGRAVFVGDAVTRTYSLVARLGDQAPGASAGALFSSFGPPSLNSRGDVAFSATLTGPPFSGLFWKPSGGALQAVVLPGDSAPGLVNHVFASVAGGTTTAPTFTDGGEFLVFGSAAPAGGGSSLWGVWRGAPGGLQLVAKRTDAAPGAPAGATFENFTTSFINRQGVALVFANLNNSPVQTQGLWLMAPGQPAKNLVLNEQQAPDMAAGVKIISFNASQTANSAGYTLNNRGEGMFLCSLNYAVNSSPANGIFAGRAGRLRKVAASGDVLEVSPGVTRTVQAVFAYTGSGPDTGRQTSINDRGEVAFSCLFVGGGGGTFLARLPHPCPGDATGDDVINFLDLNMVLSQFGMAGTGLAGDLNGDGVVDFLDLNVVLSFFGGAC